ncbi:M48 family metalloprotease [Burkholderia vietnamiensis]|uniref:hypothetical protein n=1 Tax=Burkholderia vietnamiensis TaxID=60552 RepID=UPI001CF2E966|nr:hypothetical protein [Burkholderia vietnamiensis]MCA8450513.1 hypothetical protein [Burkholderia vietnamiensis]MDN7669093.1 hypothetical protein [Burkholderia vietnamiensis]HDR8952667.1 hypothetical protein [Burkholderia vietnamiensis]HDR9023396.1 hypothetical protein [Burkholderia vietnamiensis]
MSGAHLARTKIKNQESRQAQKGPPVLDLTKTVFGWIKNKFGDEVPPPEFDLDGFVDRSAGVCGIGDIPRNLRQEVAAIILAKTGSKAIVSNEYLRDIGLGDDDLALVRPVLSYFLSFSKYIIGDEAPRKGDMLYPWVQSLFLSPDESVNASVQLSRDLQHRTLFIIVNVGTIIELTKRSLSLMADDQLVSWFGGNVQVGATHSNVFPVVPGNKNLVVVAQQIACFAAAAVLCHELAHFYRGHLGYLRTEFKLKELQEFEADSREVPTKVDVNVRKLLEFDADECGGAVYTKLMRLLDFPAVGPDEDRTVRFLASTMLAISTVYATFEEYGRSDKYYTASWRANHFFRGFFVSFVAAGTAEHEIDEGMKKFFDVLMLVSGALQRAGYGTKLDLNAATGETDKFLTSERALRQELAAIFEKYTPERWPGKRSTTR